MASFDKYMLSEPRYSLSQTSNNGTAAAGPPHPMPEDAGNWTGCRQGVGNLVGTYRDVSACMLSDHLGRPATQSDLLALSFDDVKDLFRPIWQSLGLDSLMDQQTANLVMHIRLHFGNVRLVQKGLNDMGEKLAVDGVGGPKTRAALIRQTLNNGAATYNAIRERLKENYENSNPIFRKGFLRITEEFFPERTNYGGIWAKLFIIGGLSAAAYYFLNKLRAEE